jgi:lysosomal Pro-X carboxypeptidase
MDCLNTSQPDTQGLDPNGWAVLACNEMPMPMSSSATTSMFPPEAWSDVDYSAECFSSFMQQPQYDWVFNYYGGKNPKKDFAQSSNIIFSNGELDPWHAGGVMEKINDSVVSLYIGDSAHHLDLRLPHPQDP